MKAMNKHISDMIEKLNDKNDKKIGKQLHPMWGQITENSSNYSGNIQNKVPTITSETLSSEDCFKTKLETNFDAYDQLIEQPEEELMNFIEQQHQE